MKTQPQTLQPSDPQLKTENRAAEKNKKSYYVIQIKSRGFGRGSLYDIQDTLYPIKPTLFKGEARKLLKGTRFPKPLSDRNNSHGPLRRLVLCK